LGKGDQFGVRLSYAVQPSPDGLAQAFLIGRDFIADDPCALILGDNIFYGHGLGEMLRSAARRQTGATVFAYEVADPERYGIVGFDESGIPNSIEEKPLLPKSHFAVTGLYFFDNRVADFANQINPSARGELEITTLIEMYLRAGALQVERFGRGFAWLDTGTFDSLQDASDYIATIERRQGLKVSCPEEIALRMGYVSARELEQWTAQLGKSNYASYVKRTIANSAVRS
jgi:glucose-1-phosphate thymidylyltransferase